MSSNNTYSLFPADTDSILDNQFDYFDYPKRKKGKKKKNKKKDKKAKKALAKLLDEDKGKKSKGKSKKRSKREFKYRLIEKSADKVLDTASDIARMYAESKLFPSGRGK